jgi:hypothetical protein
MVVYDGHSRSPKELKSILYNKMFYMNNAIEEQTETVLRALLNLHKTEEGRKKIIEILGNRQQTGPNAQKRPSKRF